MIFAQFHQGIAQIAPSAGIGRIILHHVFRAFRHSFEIVSLQIDFVFKT